MIDSKLTTTFQFLSQNQTDDTYTSNLHSSAYNTTQYRQLIADQQPTSATDNLPLFIAFVDKYSAFLRLPNGKQPRIGLKIFKMVNSIGMFQKQTFCVVVVVYVSFKFRIIHLGAGLAAGSVLDIQGIGVRIPVGTRFFSSQHR
jgi:hypothetical protein